MSKVLIFTFKISFAIYILWYVRDKFDFNQLKFFFENPVLLLIGPISWIINQIFLTLRLYYLIKKTKLNLTFHHVWVSNLTSIFAGNLLPGIIGTDSVKFVYLKKFSKKSKISEILSVIFVDRLLGITGLLFITSIFSLFVLHDDIFLMDNNQILQKITLLPLLLFLIISFLYLFFISIFKKFNFSKIKYYEYLNYLYQLISKDNNKYYLKVLIFNLLGILFLILGLTTIGVILQYSISGNSLFTIQLFLIPLILFANMVPLTPLGIGTAQLTMAAAFSLYGLDPSIGITISTISQVSMVFVSIILGGFYFLKSDLR